MYCSKYNIEYELDPEVIKRDPKSCSFCPYCGDFLGNDKFILGRLLIKYPQFAESCDWEKLDRWDWSALLREYPQFADQCDWENAPLP